MPKKRMKQLVPAQWLMHILQKDFQTSPACYYLPGGTHYNMSQIPKQAPPGTIQRDKNLAPNAQLQVIAGGG